MMHGPEKSDPVIVAGKPANKAEQPPAARSAGEPNAAEPVERRAGTKGNAGQQSRCRTQRRASLSQELERILDADIRSFFDEIGQEWLIRFLEHRIGDRRIIRLIQKWLKAGILEDGDIAVRDRGPGRGSVISPLFPNFSLHYTPPPWAVRWRRPRPTGNMTIV